VYLRHPSSYTPLKKALWKAGGPTSLTLGMDHDQNKAQIGQFSQRDAQRFGEYEALLSRFVDAVDPLLDSAPPNVAGNQGLFKKIQEIKPLFKAATTLGKDANQFYEMMTAPTTKILNKWFESEPLKATLATDACIGAMISPCRPIFFPTA
jgi:phytoene dehydrogenase-like protein